jgi:alkylated DNA repair dioxygenase AlkB
MLVSSYRYVEIGRIAAGANSAGTSGNPADGTAFHLLTKGAENGRQQAGRRQCTQGRRAEALAAQDEDDGRSSLDQAGQDVGPIHGPEERSGLCAIQGRTSGEGALNLADRQSSLFAEPSDPEGLRYQADFITPDEEALLISAIISLELAPFQFGPFQGKRRVTWFGWRYDYGEHKLIPAAAIPGWLQLFIPRIEAFGSLAPGSIRQVLCTEYEAGSGIGWHRDKPHFEEVFGLSLASPCRFRFRRRVRGGWERHGFEADRRSLYMLSGPSRHAWEHSIPPVTERRFSITFRSMGARAPRSGQEN